MIGGAVVGAISGGMKQAAAARQAYDALDLQRKQNDATVAQFNQQKNSDIFKAGQITDQGNAGAAAQFEQTALNSQKANQQLAGAAFKMSAEQSAGLASAGMSGVKDSGSSALSRASAVAANEQDLTAAQASAESGMKADVVSTSFSRDSAIAGAKQITDSYKEGGDAWKTWEAQKAVMQKQVDTLGAEYAAQSSPFAGVMSVLSGGLGGASAGLGMASGVDGAFGPGTSQKPVASVFPTVGSDTTPVVRGGRFGERD
jgi:hypothetical protein